MNDSAPAWGTPPGEDPRATAERIHDAARLEARRAIDQARRDTARAVVAWIRRNCVVAMSDADVARMRRELEISE